MRDQEFRARDKLVQKMTRDGLTEKNLTKGTEERVSSREKDFSYKRTEDTGGQTAPGTGRGGYPGIASGRPKTQGSGQSSRGSVGSTGEVYGTSAAGYPSENGDKRYPPQERQRKQGGDKNQPQTLEQPAYGRQSSGQDHGNPAGGSGGRERDNLGN